MFRFPPALDFSFCVGSTLQQVALGRYDVQFLFDSGASIALQSRATLLRHGVSIATWSEEQGWSSLAFQGLLNQSVQSGVVLDERTIELGFTEGFALRLHDDSDQYESMQIHVPGHPICVV